MVSCSSNLLKSSFAKPPNTLGHKRRRNSIIVVSARRASAWDPGPQNADPSVARLDEAPPTVCSAMLEILGALFVCLLPRWKMRHESSGGGLRSRPGWSGRSIDTQVTRSTRLNT